MPQLKYPKKCAYELVHGVSLDKTGQEVLDDFRNDFIARRKNHPEKYGLVADLKEPLRLLKSDSALDLTLSLRDAGCGERDEVEIEESES